MVLNGVVVKPLEPFVTHELTVCDQTFDAVTTKQADETLHDIDSLLAVGVSDSDGIDVPPTAE